MEFENFIRQIMMKIYEIMGAGGKVNHNKLYEKKLLQTTLL